MGNVFSVFLGNYFSVLTSPLALANYEAMVQVVEQV
jgi:hypothetical protein